MLFLILGVGILLASIYYTMQGYFVVQVDGDVMKDGLGRVMYEPPAWLLLFRVDEYRGFFWFVVDAVIGIGSLALTYLFIKLHLHFKEDSN